MIRYIRATWLPLTLVVANSTISVILSYFTHWLWPMTTTIIALLFVVDACSRAWEYRFLIKLPDKNKAAHWELFSTTRCAREVMMAADPASLGYYRLAGYRWYHFLPDDLCRTDTKLFKRSFWKSVCRPRKF